jgi:hypothetical protein
MYVGFNGLNVVIIFKWSSVSMTRNVYWEHIDGGNISESLTSNQVQRSTKEEKGKWFLCYDSGLTG